MCRQPKRTGFTLLELLLTIAILAILAAVTTAVINPISQMSQARDSQRKSDVSEIHKAVQQYFIDKGSYPATVLDDNLVYNICTSQTYLPDSSSSSGSPGQSGCGDLVNISRVMPAYLSGIPTDPMSSRLGVDSLYKIAISKSTGVYVEAPKTEIAQGDNHNVIFVGRPPKGYSIPVISTLISTTTVATFVSQISENIAGWPEWVHQAVVFIVGIIIGYILSTRVSLPKRDKNFPKT